MSLQCVWPVAAQLGEGALWSPDEEAVWFVDIEGRLVHRFVPSTGQRTSWPAPDRPGFIIRASDGRLIVGLAKQLAAFDPADGTFTPLVDIEPDLPDNRANDGTVGPDGALWFGTLQMPNSQPAGAWYRWDGRGPVRRFGESYVVTNGPAFSPDGSTLYFSDSIKRTILKRGLHPDGDAGAARPFAQLEPAEGYPDGLAVDADGCVWVAMFAGFALRRYDPAGLLMETISFPCANVTKPAFGGPDGRTMYVTTARVGLSENELADQPEAGSLFSLRVDTPGAAVPAFDLAGPCRSDSASLDDHF
jgi:xylono-1,5-lactonase